MPLVGQIAAGGLTEAIEQAERLDFDELFPRRRTCSCCEVNGDSMIEAQIADGDIVICRKHADGPQGRHRGRA